MLPEAKLWESGFKACRTLGFSGPQFPPFINKAIHRVATRVKGAATHTA